MKLNGCHRLSSAKQQPTHLVNGVSAYWDKKQPCSACEKRAGSESSCVTCKVAKGVDYTYTLVSKLAV